MGLFNKKHSVGKIIAELRKEKGWTQVELAEKLQVSDKAVSKWEKDDAFPSVEFFPVLAELFGVSIDYLMTGKKAEPQVVTMSKAELCAKNDDPELLRDINLTTKDENGKKHLFGFEITWAIGDESNATETCIFYDGKIHKIGAVDVEKFPKNRFMEPWKFISEDGRFNMTMVPTLDNHSDVDFKVGRMNCHQVYGVWNGDVTLDDGTKLIIKDLFTFCEYVENRW